MQIKVFKAGNMKDAMAAMKKELGEDAVILHSKKYKEGGILGIGSREVVEITAAVEESSLPKKSDTQKLHNPAVLNRYKTDGTAQGVANAEQSADNQPEDIKDETTPHSMQIDELNEKISEQKKSAALNKDFEDHLQDAQENSQPINEESAPEEESQPADNQPASEEISPPAYNEPVPEEISQPADNQPASEEESQPADNQPASEEESQPADNQPVPEENSKPAEKKSAVEEKSQQAATFTQEQMAQTQAMIMAQFNQMQMMQQAAIAQAQAQAAEQLRLQQAAQAQQAAIVQPQNPPQNEEKIRRLEEEIAQMKALLTEVLGRETKKGGVTLHEALKMQEVDEDILKSMAAQANAGDTLVDMHTPAAKATLLNYLNEHVKFSDGVKLNRHGVRIVALLGTTGVGKTTTLAKIAAKFVLEQKTSVALITADTYRISAVEQLKTYSDILELPLEIVYNPPELSSAIERHRHKELILIDTAGRSQHNEYQMRELEEFLRVNPRIEKHLVISATTKLTDARQIMNKFSQVNPDRIIFTKIDETGSVGMIVNLLNDNKYSLSYITTGQSVPDDIERATAEVLTNLLLQKVEE